MGGRRIAEREHVARRGGQGRGRGTGRFARPDIPQPPTAEGVAAADATSWTMKAVNGTVPYSIGENTYLGQHASTVAYSVTVTVNGPDSWSYSENTSLRMDQFPDILPHTDGNTLHRVG